MENFDSKLLDGKYELLKTIGDGFTSKVKLAKEIETGKFFAVKILKSKSKINPNEKVFNSEIEILKKINHPNIICIKDGSKKLIKKPNHTQKLVSFIVLELADNGELFDYMSLPKKRFGEDYGRYLFKELINGIEACHLAGVAHRDLKTENIMLSNDWDLKIADFGFATFLEGKDKSGKLNTYLGTRAYAAPEILARNSYFGSCTDIFSCGIILFALVTGSLPFEQAIEYDYNYKNFVSYDYESFWKKIEAKLGNVTNDFKSLVTLLLSYNPSQRPTICEIKNHPWYLSKCVTKEQMNEEFERRKIIVNQQRKLEVENKKILKKEIQTNRVIKTGIYKGLNSDIDFNDILELSLNRNIDYYVDNKNPYTLVTNVSDADDLFIAIYLYFTENYDKKITIKVSPLAFSLELSYKFDDETLKKINYLEVENLKLKVFIKKMDNDNLIIEFRKLQGEKLDFYDLYYKFSNSNLNKF